MLSEYDISRMEVFMDCLSNLSGIELTTLANAIAIYISKNFSENDIDKFVVFFTAIADILALVSVDKFEEEQII